MNDGGGHFLGGAGGCPFLSGFLGNEYFYYL